MLDPTKIPRDAPLEVLEQYLSDTMSAFEDGLEAAKVVVAGGRPDVDALDRYAQALEALRIGVAHRALSFGWVEPTEEDVRNARELVRLACDGAPGEALAEPARRAVRLVTDAWNLVGLQSALFCLEDDASRVQHLARILEVLDLTISIFERGCRVAGFVPAPADIARVRRLRELAAANGAEAHAELLRLIQEMDARLPRYGGVEREMAAEMLYKQSIGDAGTTDTMDAARE